MKVNHIRQNVFPVLAALIWGTAFVAQSVAADHVEPFTFTAARSAVAFVFLLVLCLVFRALRQDGDFSVAAAIGLLQSIAGLVFSVAANKISKKLEPKSALF